MEDRSALFNQLKNFSQRKLKKVETKVVTASGEQLVEKRGAKGLQVLDGAKDNIESSDPPRKLDLQVGLVLPGLLLASQDVAHDKSSLDSYGITHLLNLAPDEVENKFEDEYNYKDVSIKDKPDFMLEPILEDCFDFIDDGRHYGNVLVHCAGTIGLSRSTSLCVAYLMSKENQKYLEALNNVKEARSFVKPNEGFVKQLQEYEVKLRGAQQVKESGIDDPFALRKKQEIEQEKAMVAGASSVKNRMKMFGQNLDTGPPPVRSKSVSPAPFSAGHQSSQTKWTPNSTAKPPTSSTPEPTKVDRKQTTATSGPPPPPPPPPPPMPDDFLADKKKPTGAAPAWKSDQDKRIALPPPPAVEKPEEIPKISLSERRAAIERQQEQDRDRKVFGKVPPPPMKIKGSLTLERQDSQSAKTDSSSRGASTLKLPLKKQYTTENEGELNTGSGRSVSPSAALRAAKQRVMSSQQSPTEQQQNRKTSTIGQLNRSSTKKLLNLIKTKTKTDLTLPDGDENDEIDALLGALDGESFDKIDWDELGLDEDEVKDIIEGGNEQSSSSSSSDESSDADDDDDDDEVEEVEVEKSSQHFIIRTK